MSINGIQGNELKALVVPIDQDTNTAALVHLPDQCSLLGFETPAGLVSVSATLRKQMTADPASFKQLRDPNGTQQGTYSPVAASEPYGVKPELAAQLGSHFKIVFPSAEAGRSVVVLYRSLL